MTQRETVKAISAHRNVSQSMSAFRDALAAPQEDPMTLDTPAQTANPYHPNTLSWVAFEQGALSAVLAASPPAQTATLREALDRLRRDAETYASSRALADLQPALRQARAALAAEGPPAPPSLDVEARQLLGYLWHATGKNYLRPVSDLFADDDPIVADVERLAIFPEREP